MKNIFFNSKGMSIIEVAFGVTFASYMAYQGMALYTQTSKFNDRIESFSNLEDTKINISSALVNEDICEANFASLTLTGGSANLTQIIDDAGDPLLRVVTAGNEASFITAAVGSPEKPFSHAYYTQSLTVNQVNDTQFNLVITFQRFSHLNEGLAQIERIIKFKGTATGSQITSCYANILNVSQNVVQDACAELGGTFNAGTGQCSIATYFNTPTCGAGQYLVGFTRTGDTFQPACRNVDLSTSCASTDLTKSYDANGTGSIGCQQISWDTASAADDFNNDFSTTMDTCQMYNSLGFQDTGPTARAQCN